MGGGTLVARRVSRCVFGGSSRSSGIVSSLIESSGVGELARGAVTLVARRVSRCVFGVGS